MNLLCIAFVTLSFISQPQFGVINYPYVVCDFNVRYSHSFGLQFILASHPLPVQYQNSSLVSKPLNLGLFGCGARHAVIVMIFIMIAIAGDVHPNPRPRHADIFPCGFCQIPVSWSN